MGRKSSIDKQLLLEAAEHIIRTRGAAALSFDAIAKAAGVSKGGVQGVFGTKEALLHALFEYLDGGYEELFKTSLRQGASAVDAYVDAFLNADSSISQRVASLSLAITQEPETRAIAKGWYEQTFRELSADTATGRAEILKLCALEGAMMMRSMELLPLTEAEWDSVLAELKEAS